MGLGGVWWVEAAESLSSSPTMLVGFFLDTCSPFLLMFKLFELKRLWKALNLNLTGILRIFKQR